MVNVPTGLQSENTLVVSSEVDSFVFLFRIKCFRFVLERNLILELMCIGLEICLLERLMFNKTNMIMKVNSVHWYVHELECLLLPI